MKFRHDLSNILFSMTLCHITPSLLSKWIPSTLQQTSTYLLNKIRWKLTKTKINHQKYLYLNIIYTNFSIKGRCWYYSRYPGIPMHIKIPIGPSWQFVGNLYPTPTKKGKTITTIQNQNITTVQQNQNMHTTTNYSLYVVKSTSVIKNRCSKPRGGIFEILFNFVKEITRIF